MNKTVDSSNSFNNFQANRPNLKEYRLNQQEIIRRVIKEKYPSKFAIIYSVILLLIGFVLISLEIVSIINNGILAIGSGIWGGLVCIVLGISALSVVKWNNYSSLLFALIVHIASISILITGLVMINAMGIGFYYSGSAFNQANKRMIPINFVLIILGIIAIIFSIIFLAIICKMGIFRRRRRAQNLPVFFSNSEFIKS